MKLGERVKLLRKSQGLSQRAFGARLGMSRSVVNNLERSTLTNSNSKLPLVKLMSKEFLVSEEWLLRGEAAEIEYIPSRGSSLRQELKHDGASDFEIEMICAYLQLNCIQRKVAVRTFQEMFGVVDTAIKLMEKREKL